VLAYINSNYCFGGSGCIPQHVFTNVLVPGQNKVTFPGAGSISRSGRYLASFGITEFGAAWYFQLTDLTTGKPVYQSRDLAEVVAVADDGTAILADSTRVYLLKGGQETDLASGDLVIGIAIDAGATTATWGTQQAVGQPRILYGFDIATGTKWQISPANADAYGASLSADGKSVLYISQASATKQVFFGPSKGPVVQLSSDPSGVVEATLSGDGNYAFLTTGAGKLLRLGTTSGTSETWIGPTANISLGCIAPGSLSSVTGTGLGSASLTIAGLSPFVLSQSDTRIVIQVPWEIPISSTTVLIPDGGAPFFTDAQPVYVSSMCPQLIPLGPEDTASRYAPEAVHSDWGSLVTFANPASPGEVVHFFLTGCGAVTIPMTTGFPAPLSPLAWITTPVFITIDDIHGLTATFFGLAPGLLGIYQLDLQVPQPPANSHFIDLQMGYYVAPNSHAVNVVFFGGIPVN